MSVDFISIESVLFAVGKTPLRTEIDLKNKVADYASKCNHAKKFDEIKNIWLFPRGSAYAVICCILPDVLRDSIRTECLKHYIAVPQLVPQGSIGVGLFSDNAALSLEEDTVAKKTHRKNAFLAYQRALLADYREKKSFNLVAAAGFVRNLFVNPNAEKSVLRVQDGIDDCLLRSLASITVCGLSFYSRKMMAAKKRFVESRRVAEYLDKNELRSTVEPNERLQQWAEKTVHSFFIAFAMIANANFANFYQDRNVVKQKLDSLYCLTPSLCDLVLGFVMLQNIRPTEESGKEALALVQNGAAHCVRPQLYLDACENLKKRQTEFLDSCNYYLLRDQQRGAELDEELLPLDNPILSPSASLWVECEKEESKETRKNVLKKRGNMQNAPFEEVNSDAEDFAKKYKK